ncbi:tyrosine-type recombinase/integrase [Rhodococcus fascians]|uniref:Tyrosine recombinase XerC n=1 Tax=Rhodococcoides fascians TaxID=1828 RepID=A0A143QTP4_RHOFA|nr:tyrosine-type recombinase/integrase [Rhodococcus fascians]AMY26188.1 Tyrosine recombinase XerC [Rhodococcus fascians]KMJ47395.1 integrase [Rhodococcus fascians]MBX5333326.1 tyrosine-type recombinase/integrase [Rhodococcus fascians]MBY3989219.1 tyrosine-type recombinase/integrase [Rhodococcus fascians]MBY3998962.1 tyrosine-type recombinase/integrase [Rhodococcus fascians]
MAERQLGEVLDADSVVQGSGAAVFPDLSAEVAARIERSMSSARSAATRRAYDSAWRRFETWCTAARHIPLPAHPATVAAYLVAAADTLTVDGTRAYAPSTFGKWIAAIADRHRGAGHDNPCGHEMVRATFAGIRRDYASAGDRPRNPRAPLLTSDITAIVEAARCGVTGWASEVLERRDTALLLMGYTGAFRRSELVNLEGRDVRRDRLDGAHVRIRKSKSDQDGTTSAVKALPFTDRHESCPVCAWMRWLQIVVAFDAGGRVAVIRLLTRATEFDSHVCRGTLPTAEKRSPLFRSIRKNGNLSDTPLSGAAVHAAIRRRAAQAGYDPDTVAQLGGHSLRAGFVTQAFRNGADAHAIMRQTGHATPGLVEIYARENAPLVGNAVTELGL